MNEDKATRYQRLKRWASVMSLAWSAGLLVALVLSRASAALRDLAVRAAGSLGVPAWIAPSAVVVVYVLLVSLLHECGALPIDLYRGFVLEHRYGLATERLRHWLVDRAKALLLGLALAVPGAVCTYAAVAWLAGWWWIAAGTVFALAAVALTVVGPVVLMPLFYRSRPLEREPLRAQLVSLAARAGTPVLDAYEWRLSDRTRKANAALAGVGATKRILISDTLLADYTDGEIEVILAHELAHHVHRDIWKGMAGEAALIVGTFFVASRALILAAPSIGLRDTADVAGMPVLLLAAIAVAVAALPALNAISRLHERRADRFALDLTRNPAAFTTAMRRLASQNLAEARPSRATRWLFASHPPIEQRLEMAREWGLAPGMDQ